MTVLHLLAFLVINIFEFRTLHCKYVFSVLYFKNYYSTSMNDTYLAGSSVLCTGTEKANRKT